MGAVDPSGSAVGPCRIKLWIGDTLTAKSGMKAFYNYNTGENARRGNRAGIYQTPTVYIGVLGCGTYAPGGDNSSLDPIPFDQQIPNFPDGGGPEGYLSYEELAKAVHDALAAARELRESCARIASPLTTTVGRKTTIRCPG